MKNIKIFVALDRYECTKPEIGESFQYFGAFHQPCLFWLTYHALFTLLQNVFLLGMFFFLVQYYLAMFSRVLFINLIYYGQPELFTANVTPTHYKITSYAIPLE